MDKGCGKDAKERTVMRADVQGPVDRIVQNVRGLHIGIFGMCKA